MKSLYLDKDLASVKKMIITGFSGAGKTTLLRKLDELGVQDLDEYIEWQEAKSIPVLVKEMGWAYFRDCEKRYLQELLQSNVRIIALGGGALKECLPLLKDKGVRVLYLKCDFETCFERIDQDPNRPLLQGGKRQMFIKYQERLVDYEKSDIFVESNDLAELSKASLYILEALS